MLINTSGIFIWIGNPKPHLRRFRLAAGNFFVTCPFGKRCVFCYLQPEEGKRGRLTNIDQTLTVFDQNTPS